LASTALELDLCETCGASWRCEHRPAPAVWNVATKKEPKPEYKPDRRALEEQIMRVVSHNESDAQGKPLWWTRERIMKRLGYDPGGWNGRGCGLAGSVYNPAFNNLKRAGKIMQTLNGVVMLPNTVFHEHDLLHRYQSEWHSVEYAEMALRDATRKRDRHLKNAAKIKAEMERLGMTVSVLHPQTLTGEADVREREGWL
jgi:hypothetical protein